tara:strand:+ start:9201 stop:9431 length:231 start_codon:yes stop_codon:yes gene_type:complete
MQHTIEQLIQKINAMHDKAVELHRIRNQYSELSGKSYDKITCNHILDGIQAMALEIAYDKEGDEIKTEMEYKKNDN